MLAHGHGFLPLPLPAPRVSRWKVERQHRQKSWPKRVDLNLLNNNYWEKVGAFFKVSHYSAWLGIDFHVGGVEWLFAPLPPNSHFCHLLNYFISNQECFFFSFVLSILSPFPLREEVKWMTEGVTEWVTLCGCLVAGWRQPTIIHRSPKTFNISSSYKSSYLITLYELPWCDLSLIKKDCILFNFSFISKFLFSLISDQESLCFHAFPSLSPPTVLTLGPPLAWYNLKIFLSVSGI